MFPSQKSGLFIHTFVGYINFRFSNRDHKQTPILQNTIQKYYTVTVTSVTTPIEQTDSRL